MIGGVRDLVILNRKVKLTGNILKLKGQRKMKNLIQKLIDFRNERGWRVYHTPKELARSLMIEAAELNREFQWPLMNRQSNHNQNVKEELADIFIYGLYLCDRYNIDIHEAIEEKIKLNAIKYPVENFK